EISFHCWIAVLFPPCVTPASVYALSCTGSHSSLEAEAPMPPGPVCAAASHAMQNAVQKSVNRKMQRTELLRPSKRCCEGITCSKIKSSEQGRGGKSKELTKDL